MSLYSKGKVAFKNAVSWMTCHTKHAETNEVLMFDFVIPPTHKPILILTEAKVSVLEQN